MEVQGIFAMENGPKMVTGGLMETRVVLETPRRGEIKEMAKKCPKMPEKCRKMPIK